MPRGFALLLVAGLILSGIRPATAQIVSFTTSASPGAMTINTVSAAGFQPSSRTDNTTTYRITTIFAPTKRITAQLNSPMPFGTTLSATFAATGGGSSPGAVTLDATARNLVTGIGFTLNSTGAISYTFSATVAAGVVPSQNRQVLLTLVNDP